MHAGEAIKKGVLLMMLAACAVMSGCTQSSPQVENQAYVLVMGLDSTENDEIELSIKVPKISGGKSSEGTGESQYTFMSVRARDFENALENLNRALPRDANLAHMKLLVISRELAESQDFRRLIANIAQTERLYTATRVVVCEGSAQEFVRELKPHIGTRISSDINAMFDHYTSAGYLPASSLADLYYLTESVYSDPLVSYAVYQPSPQAQPQDEAKTVSVLDDDAKRISDSYESENPIRFLGAAVFHEGRMCGVMNGFHTLLANLIRNEVDSFKYMFEGQCLQIVPTRRVFVDVDTSQNPPIIRIDAKLSVAAQEQRPDEEGLGKQLRDDIHNTIELMRNMGADPFGFAEKAARHFPTLKSWQAYDWPKQYRKAEVDIRLSFAYTDS